MGVLEVLCMYGCITRVWILHFSHALMAVDASSALPGILRD